MIYLYGSRPGIDQRLAAVFDSEPQLLSYVNWVTLKANLDGTRKFEQGSVLRGCFQIAVMARQAARVGSAVGASVESSRCGSWPHWWR